MELKDIFKPENFRALIVFCSIYIIGRSIYYLLEGQPFAYFSSEWYQSMFYVSMGVVVPMVILTIMWPLILAFMNMLHEGLRLAPSLFYTVVCIHLGSCIIAAVQMALWDPNEIAIVEAGKSFPKLSVVLSVTMLTAISAVTSIWLYRINYRIFEQKQNQTGDGNSE